MRNLVKGGRTCQVQTDLKSQVHMRTENNEYVDRCAT